MSKRSRLDGSGKFPCTAKGCEHKSISGLRKAVARCPYHSAVRWHGEEWADSFYPEFKLEKPNT